MKNKCVCCGAIIPEGRQVCPNCEKHREEIDNERNKTAYWKERAELAKTAMFSLRQDTVNDIADWLDNEKGYCGLGFLVKKEFSVKARNYTTENLINQAIKETAEKFAKMFIINLLNNSVVDDDCTLEDLEFDGKEIREALNDCLKKFAAGGNQ